MHRLSEGGEVRNSFYIVAIGASAAGLAPTTELLRELGAEPRIALVVIHHLDPTQDSGLVDILSRSTPLPVLTAESGVRVEPNRVYVMPPNAGLLISEGVLKLVPRVEEAGLHLPINRFFESLATDREGLAVGVVLSGSGFDGTEGVKAIKREGGITMAQDATAQYRSMPDSAIETECVDFVLPPAGLARELRRLGAERPSLRAPAQSGADEHLYARILSAMQSVSGVDFSSYKHTTIRRRLERRLFFHGLTDLAGYVQLLERDPAEVGALCEEALIHVTGFFRDPEAFEALRTQVWPKICEGRARDAPIRVWVPGCSTAEEVYSILICLLEFLAETQRNLQVQIFGTDLSPPVIEKARAGRYPVSIENEVSEARLLRFFLKDESGYRVRRDVRDLCVFAKHDVARDPPFSSMDLISCRNLMIYLGPELQDRVITLLHYALNEPGFLLLGTAETIRAFAGFSIVDGKNKIFARTSAAPRLAFDFTAPKAPLGVAGSALEVLGFRAPALGTRAAGPDEVHREADRLVLPEFAPPGVVVTSDLAVVQFRGRTGAFLEHAPGTASLDLLRTVREELRLPVRRAIDRARSTETTAREARVPLLVEGKRRAVIVEVIPFTVHAARQQYFLVLFEDVTQDQGTTEAPADAAPEVTPDPQTAESTLRQELASTRQYLESVIEQLAGTNEEVKAASEEIVSSNEELRSTSEELQSAKEELQATNEELQTVNDEMRDRSVEATRLSDDLTNVLTSIELPILIVGRDLRLRRFTPAAGAVFGLLATDLGLPIGGIPRIVAMAPELSRVVGEILQQVRPMDSSIQDSNGRWYELSVRPYLTVDGRIDGTVISARNVDAERKIRDYQDRLQRMAFDATLTEERERRRIAVELHDRIGHSLALAEIKLTAVRGELVGEPRIAVDGAVVLLEQAIADKRSLVFELSPPLLYDLGLKEALVWLAEDFEQRYGIAVTVTDDGADKPLSDATRAIVFRAVRELAMNVFKHANTPTTTVSFRRTGDHCQIDVVDGGVGFDPAALAAPGGGGFGLLSVREQIARLGGTLELESAPGQGTRASVRVPLQASPGRREARQDVAAGEVRPP